VLEVSGSRVSSDGEVGEGVRVGRRIAMRPKVVCEWDEGPRPIEPRARRDGRRTREGGIFSLTMQWAR